MIWIDKVTGVWGYTFGLVVIENPTVALMDELQESSPAEIIDIGLEWGTPADELIGD